MSTKDFTATEDENFFKELDKHSAQFRQDANDMVESFLRFHTTLSYAQRNHSR